MSNTKNPQTRTTTNKMLIDATHPEETRVVVLRDNRVEEFDYESAARKLLRGNIYLAKVTRVEPSLQAAFVDYGGNRHGFLAFNEIHPDYYQIPIADRRALIEAEAAEEAEAAALADAEADNRPVVPDGDNPTNDYDSSDGEVSEREDTALDVVHLLPSENTGSSSAESSATGVSDEPSDTHPGFDRNAPARAQSDPAVASPALPPHSHEPHTGSDHFSGNVSEPSSKLDQEDENGDSFAPHQVGLVEDHGVTEVTEENGAAEVIEEVTNSASEDALEELPSRPRRRQRSYKIQEVIKRKQIILVQVVKEERGTKGAALTTYLSLAGRYTVLMPNTARGGGISRKITNPQDRKRLKAIADELDVPDGMGLIIRTAGASRTKQEIRRDFEYLLRLWESVRELTLQSTAPALVYEEGNLVKRSIRDLYGKEVDEIMVAGEAAFREAKDFMRMLMPSHVKNVLQHTDAEPLFTSYQIERQLNAMFSPYVHLRSGGYLVINQTEALVAIDVNSGKATREFSIEETALNTNLEAAEELARQLKLRDLAGLIVVDFIDMEEKRNNRAVERRLKDALRNDRARIQVGHISHFGLLEMSRQRMRTGVLEGSTSQCPHCQGTGIIRSTESVALGVLRALEDALTNNRPAPLLAHTTANVALYLLNNKRQFIIDIEQRYGVPITVLASDKHEGSDYSIEQAAYTRDAGQPAATQAISMDWGFNGDDNRDSEEDGETRESADNRKRGRRRKRRGRRDENGTQRNSPRDQYSTASDDDFSPQRLDENQSNLLIEQQTDAAPQELDDLAQPQAEGEAGRGRRRGRRGGRRNRRGRGNPGQVSTELSDTAEISPVEHEDAPTHFNGAIAYPDSDDRRGIATDGNSPGETVSSEPKYMNAPPITGDQHVADAAVATMLQADGVAEQTATADQQIACAPTEPAAASDEFQPRDAPAEPVLERIIVTPDQQFAQSQSAEPAKRGWWQRK